ncbi:MAG TPA: sigma 54-interacting transcriptional regulator [Verrucomicrobiae bacterium]
MPPVLTSAERKIVEVVNALAFLNPFNADREAMERRFSEMTGGVAGQSHDQSFGGFFKWVDQLPAEKRQFAKFAGKEREEMRALFLFEGYHRNVPALDELIGTQLLRGEKSCPAPFGRECVDRMVSRGFARDEAVRYFGIFYQLRRAHSFIVRGLKGRSACMFQFRRRLWKSVFTDDVRWYERHLWNRMEDFSTLLLGETGSGKGTAASAIGRSGFIPYLPERGEFAESFNRTFVSINLAEFPETLIETELFGYRKGAFTGAVGSHEGVFARCSPHGAIFLDEVGEIRKDIQVKLLHVLQDRRFSPVGSREQLQFRGRVISATNRSLQDLRAEKLFRDDFYYRISSDVIPVPTLRERLAEDSAELDLLLETILERTAGERWSELLPTVRERLEKSAGRNYRWPGNVRELEQAVRRVLLHGSYEPEPAESGEKQLDVLLNSGVTVDELLNRYCSQAVHVCGSRAEAARRLQVDVRTLQKYAAQQNG